ncbi:MAG: response regulator [Roseibium sp.]|uniref:hybrid sensor histidine kinase/response regulator n=1 Tax=Roseibium sp. TaxID=1936156 RepID=UPI001B07D1E0|nr:ATP-binding protein [Roseibium sp.]MBO6895539.1 response regulator [Roseibium sp.]
MHLANSDNTGWIVAQLEVDHQDLMLRLARALPPSSEGQGDLTVNQTDLQQIKQDFDILFSRITVFEAGLKRLLASGNLMAEFEKLKTIRQDLADHIDSIRTPDVAALREFQDSVTAAYPLVREIAVAALQETVSHTAEMRRQERRVFLVFLVQSIVLVVLMVLSAFLAMRIWRDLEVKTAEKFRIGGLLSRAFNSSLNAVLVTDRHARILYSNAMAQNIFGTKHASIKGLSINQVISLDDSELSEAGDGGKFGVFTALINTGPKIVRSKNSQGNPIFVEILLVRDKDIAGREVVICFIRDITDQVIAEGNLKDALRIAEQASSAKSAFLATMSHEMRTPLHGIMASLELMKDSALTPTNLNLLETAEACSLRALTQINNVLEMARLGQQYEAPSALQPDHIARDILRELKPLANRSHNALELVVQGPFTSCRLEGLPYTFSQVLYNLVDNAIKFTESGSVMVRLSLSEPHSGTATLLVEVTDTGIGISEEAQAHIFEEFRTADPNRISPKSGSGLGLSIAKRGVNMQGGELLLRSSLGKGSQFHFQIPLKTVPVEVKAEPALVLVAKGSTEASNVAKKILIVDDSEINLFLMREMLHRMGHEVDFAENGEIAVAKAAEIRYDAILMDFSMPVMDGPTAAEKIREMQTAPGRVAIIGVTALIDANADPRNWTLFDEILIKPVGQALLATAIEHGTAPHAVAPEPVAEEGAPFAFSVNAVETEDLPVSTSFDEVMSLVGEDTAIRLLQTSFLDVEQALRAIADPEITLEDKVSPIHKSVGSTALLGFEDLSDSLSEAEVMALSGSDPNGSELPKLIAAILKETRIQFSPLIAAHEKAKGSLADSDA